MFIVVIGECSSGKSAYLQYLRDTVKGSYFMGVDDARRYNIDTALIEKVFGDEIPLDGFKDKEDARRKLTDACRECSVLLVDQVGFGTRSYSDGRLINNWLAEIGRYKNVITVSHDILKLYNADRIVTLNWDDGVPKLQEVDLDEAEKIVSV
ncbi:hypothetical protein [Brotaphodocola sp.]|uniref:hypothetical protein n=1 Tax=Brotaphodocola sp. TaxID=3073577 RepID=UPI003D7CFAAC